MLFRELWSLRAPVCTSCLGYCGDLLWITLCTFITLKMLFKGSGPYEKCPRPARSALSKQHKELCTFVYSFKFFDIYITAYIRDIINSGHNVSVKKRITSFTVTKVSEARQQIHIFSNSISNTVNMSLPFKLVIKNNTKVTMF